MAILDEAKAPVCEKHNRKMLIFLDAWNGENVEYRCIECMGHNELPPPRWPEGAEL